jgi:hypothetical protein
MKKFSLNNEQVQETLLVTFILGMIVTISFFI